MVRMDVSHKVLIPRSLRQQLCRHIEQVIPPKCVTLAIKCSDSAEDIRQEAP